MLGFHQEGVLLPMQEVLGVMSLKIQGRKQLESIQGTVLGFSKLVYRFAGIVIRGKNPLLTTVVASVFLLFFYGIFQCRASLQLTQIIIGVSAIVIIEVVTAGNKYWTWNTESCCKVEAFLLEYREIPGSKDLLLWITQNWLYTAA